MKIAIFGDSFGDDHINWIDRNDWLDVGPSWIDYLRQYHDIDNFCEGGSSLYYSKIIFDKTDLSKYDKVIFIVTSPYRRTNYNSSWNLGRLDSMLAKKDLDLEWRTKLLALKSYFLHVWNESDQYFHDLMVKDITTVFPSTLHLSYNQLDKISNDECKKVYGRQLHDIFQAGYSDARKCHMCEENNLILGKQIQHCLENNLELTIDLEKFVTPPREFDYYFRKVT
jgi:hypothetical protein